MHRRLIHMLRSLPLALLAAAAGCDKGTSNPAPDGGTTTRKLTLLYTNDEHSHLFAHGPEVDDYPPATMAGTGALQGGVARRKVLLDAERAAAKTAGADTLTVSAGDTAMGTLAQVAFTATSPDYTIMKQLGYDVICLGNHEFDFGPDALARSIGAAMKAGGLPQLVASNIRFSDKEAADDSLAALYGEGTSARPIKRYHVVTTASGIKVGFFGVLGADAAFSAPFKTPVLASGDAGEENHYEVVRPKIYAAVQPVVDALRNVEKVDVVVALSHAGVDLDRPENGDDWNIAQNVAGIDVIVSGHTHTVVDKPIVVKNGKSGKDVVIVQAGSYGRYLGRLPLTVQAGGGVTFDQATAQLLSVDDKTIPDPAVSKSVEGLVTALESLRDNGKPSFLEGALGRVLGKAITDDANKIGDLYFYKLGTTTYPIAGVKRFVETNVLDLSADAQLAAGVAALAMEPPEVAVQAAGVVRADIDVGKTGALSFADAFRTFPLGFSPADGSVGYPLTHFYIYLVELKAAFELGASLGLQSDSFYLGASGMRVTIDTTRKAFDAGNPTDPTNGRVTKIEWDSQHRIGEEKYDTVLFDIARNSPDPWTSDKKSALDLVHVVTNLYIASFASAAGVTLKDKAGKPVALAQTILRRGDTSEVKDYEAFAAWLKQLSDMNGGKLPSRYDAASPDGKLPRRNLCSGPLCGKY